MKTVRFKGAQRSLSSIPSLTTIGQPESVWVEWEEEYVPKAGPRRGRTVRSTQGVLIPRSVFEAAMTVVKAWKPAK